MPLTKPKDYKEVPALQNGENVYAQDHNQIIANIEKLKGGKPNEAPVSNIKELKEILDKLTKNGSLDASSIYFDNTKAQLKYIKYNFPKFKLDIPEKYEIIFTDGEGKRVCQAFIENLNDGTYRFNSNISNYYCNIGFGGRIMSVSVFNTPEEMYSILSQFFDVNINKVYNLDSDEVSVSTISEEDIFFNISINNRELCFFIIIKNKYLAANNYNIFLNIKNRVLNRLDRNLFFSNNLQPPFFRLELVRKDNKVKVIGSYQHISGISSLICYSPILEKYFNIIGSNDDLINTDGITSSSGKPKKFGFMRYNDQPYIYCLKIANQDGTRISQNEIITFDLTPDKNAEIEVTEKVIENIQDALEALSDNYGNDFDSPLEEKISNFNIVSYLFNPTIIDNKVKDCSQLLLVKNADNSYSLKGNIELYKNANSSSSMIIKTANTINTIGCDIKNIIPYTMTDNLYIASLAHENYIYLMIQKINENPVIEEIFDNIKLIDSNIVLFNNKLVNEMSSTKVSDDFGIVYEGGKYKIKGQLTFSNEEASFNSITNNGISDFFENNEEYSINTNEGTLKAIYHRNNNIMCGLEFQGNAGTTYNIDWVLPKQI